MLTKAKGDIHVHNFVKDPEEEGKNSFIVNPSFLKLEASLIVESFHVEVMEDVIKEIEGEIMQVSMNGGKLEDTKVFTNIRVYPCRGRCPS